MTKQPSFPSDVPGSEPVRKTSGFQGEGKNVPNVPAFEEALEKASPPPKSEETTELSPLNLAQGKISPSPSFDSLIGQINTTNTNLNELQNNLRTPNLQFKESNKKLLDTKLQDAYNNIRSASEKMGAPILPSTQISKGASPVSRFLGYVTDGQNQLMEAQKTLQGLQAAGTQLNPPELLLVQVKLAQAQQSLEYSSVLLSKLIDAIKQMMNIQI
ncbi:MAG: hypothetical protein JW769_01170 [Parachlamydiales bacterium]|nr:hypothetical protein [Parachlamydiales bacterium]